MCPPQINLYDFNRPGFSAATGHVTQMLWKGTSQLGCAAVSGCNRDYYVCQYYPPGNVNSADSFRANVLRA